MNTQSKRVLLVAVISYLAAFIADYISKIRPPRPTYSVMTCIGEPWSVWNYLALVSMMLALGLTIAGIKLMRH